MKKSKLNLLPLFFSIFFLHQNLFSQTAFSVSPTFTTYNHFGVDISNNSFVIPFQLTLQNDSTELLKIRWHRIMANNCPAQWKWETQDKNLFFTHNLTSNVDDILGTYSPLDMEAGEIDENFSLYFSPMTTNGCCGFKIEFTEVNHPEKLLAVAYFDVRLNATSSNCLFTSNEELEESNIEIFPNPTSDFIKIKSEKVFEKIEIHSWNGQILKTLSFSPSSEYDLTHLPSGIYTLIISSKKMQPHIFKLVKLNN